MASKIFLDANFLLDLTLKRTGFADASAVIELALEGRVQLFATPSVIHITGYFTKQTYTHQQVKNLLLTLLTDVHVIDCDHATAVTAINSNMEDIEDALQYFTALRHNIEYFISNDKKLKKVALPQLPVYTTAELLAELKND